MSPSCRARLLLVLGCAAGSCAGNPAEAPDGGPDVETVDAADDAAADGSLADGRGVVCGAGVCATDPGTIRCVDPDAGLESCEAGVACAPTVLGMLCDGPEDCPAGSRCCAVPRLAPFEWICRGTECPTGDRRVCHRDVDCRPGDSCCPFSAYGRTFAVCLGYSCP